MANKVKMLEDKLGGSEDHHHAAAVVPVAVAQPIVPPAAGGYEPGPIPYGAAGKQPAKAHDETSFTRPPTASTYHGGAARPKSGTLNSKDDTDNDKARPTSRRSSLDLPYIAE